MKVKKILLRAKFSGTDVTIGKVYKIKNDGEFLDDAGDCRNEVDFDWESVPTEPEKDVNPKAVRGDEKAPLHAYPMLPIIQLGNVMAGGAHKYGLYNYRKSKISAQTYIGAIQRHLFLWADGVDIDEESQQSHLAHVMACCSILLDRQITGQLVDDRSKTGFMQNELDRSKSTFKDFKDNVKGLGET